jgi:hypothetical protein
VNTIKPITLLGLLLLLAACGGGNATVNDATGGANAAALPPTLSLETTLPLGDVPNGRIVERDVTVTNTGDAPLVVESLTTSCGCTTATLDAMTIAPQATATLHIAFDSGAHGPDLRGELLRQVILVSNDPARPETLVELTANITDPTS